MEKGDNQVKDGEGSLMIITDSENGSMSTCLVKSLYLHSRYDIHTLSVFISVIRATGIVLAFNRSSFEKERKLSTLKMATQGSQNIDLLNNT